MAYLTINGTGYRSRINSTTGRILYVENEVRVLDASLVTDRIAEKRELRGIELIGPADSSDLFTVAEAEVVLTVLAATSVTVGGDIGALIAKPKDVGFYDMEVAAGLRRIVTVSFLEI